MLFLNCRPGVAELADAPDSKSGGRKAVWLKPPPPGPLVVPPHRTLPSTVPVCFCESCRCLERRHAQTPGGPFVCSIFPTNKSSISVSLINLISCDWWGESNGDLRPCPTFFGRLEAA